MFNFTMLVGIQELSGLQTLEHATFDSGLGGECNSGNFTFPPAQHIPGVSFIEGTAILA